VKPQVFVLREDRHANALWAFLKLNWRELAAQGKPLVITVGPEKTKRSVQANAYYWGVTLKQIAEQVWIGGRQFSADVWHEDFKDRFAPRIDKPLGGSSALGTHDMTVEQFHVFQREVEVFAAQDLGVQFVDDQAVPAGWAA